MRSRLSGLFEMILGGILVGVFAGMGPYALITLPGILLFVLGLRSFQTALARDTINELKEALDRLELMILAHGGKASPTTGQQGAASPR